MGSAVARVAIASSVVAGVSAIALSSGAMASTVAMCVVALGAPFLFLAAWVPARGAWKASQQHASQARRVEAHLPGLRGRLITVVQSANNMGSPALFERAAAHAAQATQRLSPQTVHPAPKRLYLSTMASFVGVALLGSFLAIGPLDAIFVLFGASVSSLRLRDSAGVDVADTPLVGDITLRYIYPEYTGLEPREVPSSDGTIIAPRGTVVQILARTATVFEAAAVQVEGSEPVDAVLTDGRDIAASLNISTSSAWRFVLFEGKNVTLSKDYALRVEADSPPVVVLSESGKMVVPVDRPLGLRWNVTDDYGVVEVSVEIDTPAGLLKHIRREPISAALALSGLERATPRSLGLEAGQTVTLRVVAIDNDRAEGGNRGESEPLVLEVLGPRGYGKNLARYHEKLRDAMLDPLADFLEEPVPPSLTRSGLVRWASAAAARFDPMRAVVEAQWGTGRSSGIDGDLVHGILEDAARLTRFTLIAFDRSASAGGQQPTPKDVEIFSALHGALILSLETAIYVIDSMLKEVGVAELARQARRVADSAMAISERAQQSEDPNALAAALDRLERQLGQLRKAVSKLSDNALAEFTNSTLDQSAGLIEQIRKALADGDAEGAKEMMETLADQLAQLAEGLDDRQQRGQDKDDEMSERFEALMADLEQLALDQSALATSLAEAQDAFGSDFSERMSLWDQIDPLAEVFESSTEAAVHAVGDGRGWQSYVIRRVTEAASLAKGVHDSVAARDATGAARRGAKAGQDLPITRRMVERSALGSATIQARTVVGKHLHVASQTLIELSALLAELESVPGESNPELEDATRALARAQAGLYDRQRGLGQEVKTIENALPVATGEAAKSMARAGQAMELSADALDQAVAVSAEGHQRRAVDLVRETAEHLKKSMEDQAKMQQSMAAMRGEQKAQQGDEGGDSPSSAEPEIPAPELFKTNADYRRALLEGMAGDVPSEFEALKKRFYEDLVHQ